MPWSLEVRQKLLDRIAYLVQEQYGENMDRHTEDELMAFSQEEELLELEYAENLPFLPLSRCPICKAPFEMAFDRYGLDGAWWWKLCPVELPKPESCEHFRVFLGAIDLHGRAPSEVTEGVSPGPGAPFVIDRLLGMDGVQAVLSSFGMQTGDVCYLIVYFSQEPIHQGDLHQEWRKEFYTLFDEDGEPEASESKNDIWNFEIAQWISRGKLWWINPGDESLALQNSIPSPYDDLRGTNMKQEFGGGEGWVSEPPDGSEISVYEYD